MKGKEEKIKKKGKVKQENCSILGVVEDINVAALGLKPTQVKFVTLRVSFLSQLVHVRCALPNQIGVGQE